MRRRISAPVAVAGVVALSLAGLGSPARATGSHSARAAVVTAGGGGQLDSTVGTGGLTLTPGGDGAFSLAQGFPDLHGGAYVVADGDTTSRIFHYTSPTALDTTYPAVTATAGYDFVDVQVDTAGLLYALEDNEAGTSAVLVRYTAAGAPDTTFGTAGSISVSADAFDLTVGSQDLYVTDFDADTALSDVVAYATSGALDTSFGAGGALSFTSLLAAQVLAESNDIFVVLDAAGVAAGAAPGSAASPATSRLPARRADLRRREVRSWTASPNAASAADHRIEEFSLAGVQSTTFITHLATDQVFDGIAADSSGTIYAELDTIDPSDTSERTSVVRLLSSGSSDSTYGPVMLPVSPGQTDTSSTSTFDYSEGVGLEAASDGTVYAYRDDNYSSNDVDSDSDFIGIARVSAAGRLDPTFGVGGVATIRGTHIDAFFGDIGEGEAYLTGFPLLLSDGDLAVSGATMSGDVGLGQLTSSTASATFVPATGRLTDTRESSTGLVDLGRDAVPAGAFTGAGIAQATTAVPSDATSVLLDVSVVSPTSSGFVRVTGGYGTAPTTALNFTKGVSQTVLVASPVGSAGEIGVSVSGTTNLVIDQLGYEDQHTPAGGETLTSVGPIRAVDTRTGTGTSAGPKNGAFTVTLPPAVPAGATALLNITATTPTATGFLQLAAHGATPVTAVNYRAHQSATALAITGTNGNRQIDIVTHGSTQVVVDVVGYLAPGTGEGEFVPVPATRIVDSRIGLGTPESTKTGAVTITVPTSLIPTGATGALLNITTVTPSATGYVTLKATGGTSTATILNTTAGQSLTALAITSLSSTDQATITVAGTRANLVVDVIGYYS